MKSINAIYMTPIIMAIDFKDLKIRVTLRTLNVRKTLTVRKAWRPPAPSPPPFWEAIINSMIEMVTTPPSRRFMGSATYFLGPLASNFNTNSTMKIQVKISFISSRSLNVCGSMLYESMAIPIVFTSTHKLIAFSNRLVRTKPLRMLRPFLTNEWKPFGHTRREFICLTTQLLLVILRLISRTSWPDQIGYLLLNYASTKRTSVKSMAKLLISLGRLKALLISSGILSPFSRGSFP